MRRSIIIALCVFNALLACGLVWYVLAGPRQSPRPVVTQSGSTDVDALSEAELWAHASAADHVRKAMHYLSRIQDKAVLLNLCKQRLSEMNEGTPSPYSEWPFLQAVIQTLGRNVDSAGELAVLQRIAGDRRMPLTLRDSAFRSVIENTPRFAENGEAMDSIFALIDACSTEPNSLSETSLLAEHFLAQQGIAPEGRKASFRDRLTELLKNSSQDASQRIAALNILTARGELETIDFSQIYASADRQLQTAILKRLSQTEELHSLEWLHEIRPTNPEQEQLLQLILD